MTLLPLVLLAILLGAAAPGVYVRALAAARLSPTPWCLGLRPRDFGADMGVRALRLGLGRTLAPLLVMGLAAAFVALDQRVDAAASLVAAWALVLAARADRQFGVLPPFLSILAGLAGIAAIAIDAAVGQEYRGGLPDLASAAFVAASIEAGVRAHAALSGRRILGQGDPPLVFAVFAWAGPIGGALAVLAALTLVLTGAMFARRRPSEHAPLGVALAAALLPFVLFPDQARETVDAVLLWLIL